MLVKPGSSRQGHHCDVRRRPRAIDNYDCLFAEVTARKDPRPGLVTNYLAGLADAMERRTDGSGKEPGCLIVNIPPEFCAARSAHGTDVSAVIGKPGATLRPGCGGQRGPGLIGITSSEKEPRPIGCLRCRSGRIEGSNQGSVPVEGNQPIGQVGIVRR